MKRKLTIAAGIIHEPEILSMSRLLGSMESADRLGYSKSSMPVAPIFLTTHYIEEAERLCHRIGFITSGEIVKVSSVRALMNEAQQEKTVEFAIERGGGPELGTALLQQFSHITVKQMSPDSIRISAAEEIQLMPFMRFFDECGIVVREAKILRPSLEEVFVKLTGIEISKLKEEKGGGKK